MTFNPTHKPASASRIQRMCQVVSLVLAVKSAKAKKSMPRAICCEATPQQAVAKKVELSIVANVPSMVASGESLSCRKKVHAPSPRINKAIGARNFANPTGPKSNFNNVSTLSE